MSYPSEETNWETETEEKGSSPDPGGRPVKRTWFTVKTAPYVLLLPAVLLFLIFTAYPIIASFWLSFQTTEAGERVFVGLNNYVRLFQDPIFYQALGNTLLLLVLQVPIMIFLAVILAVLMNSAFLKMKGFFRVAFFTPAVTSLVAASVIFLLLLNPDYGLINYLLTTVGLEPVGWLNNPFWAKVSLVLVMLWRWTGYNMIILLAGLQNISNDLYEAARIDGAGKVRQFFSITIPQLRPVILFAAIISTIGTLQLFDEPYTLTGGGPVNATTTITMYLYENGFEYFDFEYASAIAYVVVVIIAILSFLQFRLGGERK
ncbi:sugar ABC transporter permease [Marinococcus halophilus]|uniref:Lactose ABC transporter permease n=1 Tax=Marinococcus halophilus TaxID=1371 RepID=A0A510Y5M8_MARHA|nr:sugar ABC transporter permease [Marinococcus halophilus]OZT80377.1 sugar ABC transporter permease [Marinococcus halophilus]GEK58443.1 lactose ABC transporter permease [Marinococcus halophilus]